MSDNLPTDPASEHIMSIAELDRRRESREAVIRELAALLNLTMEQQGMAHRVLVNQWYLRMYKIVHENEMRVEREKFDENMRQIEARMKAAGINTEGL